MMRRWLLTQMLVLAALVTAACTTNTPLATPTPTPSLTPAAIATPTPDDAVDNAYYRCGEEVGYKLAELTDEIGQTPFTDNILCAALQGWRETLDGIRAHHSDCVVPKSTHLLRARDSLDAALEGIAEALFYLTQYCGPPRGGEEYWESCLDAVLEAQFHADESRRAFDAFIAGDTEALHGTEGRSSDYTVYTNAELRFSAEYPVGWEVKVIDNRNPTTGEPLDGKIAGFLPPEGDRVKQRAISVLVLPTPSGVQLGPKDMPTDQGYIDYIRGWAEMMPVEIVGDPLIVEVDGYRAVEVVARGTGEYETSGIVGYQTFLVTEDRAFYIEASGEAESEPEIIRIYEHFVATFDVLPLP